MGLFDDLDDLKTVQSRSPPRRGMNMSRNQQRYWTTVHGNVWVFMRLALGSFTFYVWVRASSLKRSGYHSYLCCMCLNDVKTIISTRPNHNAQFAFFCARWRVADWSNRNRLEPTCQCLACSNRWVAAHIYLITTMFSVIGRRCPT